MSARLLTQQIPRICRSTAMVKRPAWMSPDCLSTTPTRGIRYWQVNTLRLMWLRGDSYDRIPDPPTIRSNFQDWNYAAELSAFNQRLGENLDMSALKVCLTDESYVKDQKKKQDELGVQDVFIEIEDNSKLADEGLKLMSPFIKSYLRSQFTHLPEEGICAMHDLVMCEETLSEMAYAIGARELILYSPIPPDPSPEIRARIPPALVASIEKVSGRKQAEKFICDLILPYYADKDPLLVWSIEEPEICLSRILKNNSEPEWEARILRQAGVNTIEAIYLVGIYVNKRLVGKSPGETIPIARRMAVLDALRRLFRLTDSRDPLAFGEAAYSLDLQAFASDNVALKDWSPSRISTTSAAQKSHMRSTN